MSLNARPLTSSRAIGQSAWYAAVGRCLTIRCRSACCRTLILPCLMRAGYRRGTKNALIVYVRVIARCVNGRPARCIRFEAGLCWGHSLPLVSHGTAHLITKTTARVIVHGALAEQVVVKCHGVRTWQWAHAYPVVVRSWP